MKILFLVPYPIGKAPSQRFRFEQYLSKLDSKGIDFTIQSFLNSRNWQVFAKSGQPMAKALALCNGFLKRIGILFKVAKYDYVMIHREASPIGPPVIEWIISKIFRKRMIYDFDDAIWKTDRINESTVTRLLKWRSKVASICKWSYKISCGNDYLASFAFRYNDKVILNPTTIDLEYHVKPAHPKTKNEVVIGWTGSYSTVKYLNKVENVLAKILEEFPFVKIVVISDRHPDLQLNRLTFVPWKKETEMEDLQQFDIGIMPLPDDEWSKGKCGFKLLQYFAIGIPAVADPVGVNAKIITHGVSGFLCTKENEWMDALRKLIADPVLRKTYGEEGRKTVERSYSVEANSDNFFSLFE